MSTFAEQAATFDWRAYDIYCELWQNGEANTIETIAGQWNKSPCDVRRTIDDGDRLAEWRPQAGT